MIDSDIYIEAAVSYYDTRSAESDRIRVRFNEKLQKPTVVARLCGRPTLVIRQLTTRRIEGASFRDCGRTTVWSVDCGRGSIVIASSSSAVRVRERRTKSIELNRPVNAISCPKRGYGTAGKAVTEQGTSGARTEARARPGRTPNPAGPLARANPLEKARITASEAARSVDELVSDAASLGAVFQPKPGGDQSNTGGELAAPTSWARFNESDHANNRRATINGLYGERRSSVDRALFHVLSSDRSPPSHHDCSSLDARRLTLSNNRRATITGFNRERRSSVDRALFDILSSDRSPPLTPRLLVATIPDSFRRFQKVSLTNWAPAGDFKTDCDAAKTIALAEDNQTVCDDSVRRCQSPRPAAHLQDTSRQSTMGPRPSGHLQKNHRLCQTVSQTSGVSARDSKKSAKMPRPSWYLQETHRRCQTVIQTVGSPEGDSQTVYDVGKTIWAPAEDSHTMPDNIEDRRGTSTISDSLRRCQDRPGTCR
ncbi:hypothetical protein DPMN_094739 [Dreissena polymorpha]|uniref:Uncharacterized protein n=1 Tax=Dreissena polymorpha TaxID=45954 RepID=A0A9D4R2X8_DREPO|nr:hypothetical protein DPMN_094739 [Dreissena polymorpha]